MNVNAIYFSPTGTTSKIVESIARKITKNLRMDTSYNVIDFTAKDIREGASSFNKDDIAIIGVPVYAGRVPNILLNYLNTIRGNGALAICIVVYGNRNYDDALIELRDVAEADGFHVIAAGAFVGEHSFSKILAKGRPDEKDLDIAIQFADQICSKINKNHSDGTLVLKGEEPYRKYYMPKDKEGNPVDIRKVTPKTNADCINCKLCAEVCPMGSIDFDDTSKLNGICIKCGACIKKCPVSAKYYDDIGFLRHKYELEEQFKERREPELFV